MIKEAIYGLCPICHARGIMRERCINGNDVCARGHRYLSSTSILRVESASNICIDSNYGNIPKEYEKGDGE